MASKIPINVTEVMKEAVDIDGAAHTPVSVSLYIDSSAPGDLASAARSFFAGGGEHVRVSIQYVDAAPVSPNENDDMAVVVAGFAEWVGAESARIRSAGVPVVVMTNMPSLVEDMAKASGSPIPDGDIAFPSASAGSSVARDVVESVLEVVGAKAVAPVDESRLGDAPPSDEQRTSEPIALNEEAKSALAQRLGEWVIAACREKRLAFALAFEFVRRPLALEIVRANSVQNAGIGAVMFIPGADMPLMTLNQSRMLLQIAAAYGKPMNIDRAKELALVVGSAFACRGVARQLAGMVPGLGWAAKAGVAYAGTGAMGRAAIEYFEAGGDAAGLASIVGKMSGLASEALARASSNPVVQNTAAAAKDAVWTAYDAFGKSRR